MKGPPRQQLSSHTSIYPISLVTAPLSLCTNKKIFSNPFVSSTIRIWVQFCKHFNFNQTSGLCPIIIFLHLCRLTRVLLAGVNFEDLFEKKSFISFEFIVKDHNIPKSHFFRYLQVHSFASRHFHSYPKPLDKYFFYVIC